MPVLSFHRFFSSRIFQHRLTHKIWVALFFTLLFVAVDKLSYIHPLRDLNITPWNPPAAVEVMFLYWAGTAWMAWVYVTLCLADVLVRDAAWLSHSVVLGNAVLVACYGAIALSLRLTLGKQRGLRVRRDIVWLGLTALAGSLITAFFYVSTQTLIGNLGPADWVSATHRFFVGDLLGLMVFLPLFFVITDRRRRKEYAVMFGSLGFWLLTALLLVCMVLVFSLALEAQMKYFFIFFFLLGLISATHALPGATFMAAVIQIPLVFSVTHMGASPTLLMDMQFVMLTLSLTGLIIGAVVDERLRTQERLRDSMQLIAVGQLAGALAHELHQPMSAVSAYAESALMLAPPEPPLREVLNKILKETLRATDIVRGLRSYFSSGSSSPQSISISGLVQDCVARAQGHACAKGLRIQQNNQHQVDLVWVDPVQMGAAIGNLLKNAIEASPANAEVEVRLSTMADRYLSIQILDQGAYLSEEEAEDVFKPFYSQKKEGLGLGLSLSQALVEHNGGLLRYMGRAEKSFQILLPTKEFVDETESVGLHRR